MNNKYRAIIVVALVVVGGGLFYGGIQYDKNATAQAKATARTQFGSAGNNGQGGQGQTRGGTMGVRGKNSGGLVTGEILSKDEKGLTVKTSDGGSILVYFGTAIDVRKATVGNISDLTIGQQVTINGKNSPDGSVFADIVSIVPDRAE